MPIFVSEPGRPASTRPSAEMRQRQINAMDDTAASHRPHLQSGDHENDPVEAIDPRSDRATARRALNEYGNQAQDVTDDTTYLPVNRLVSSYQVVSVSTNATLAEGLQTMERHGVHHLAVLDGADVAGIVNQRLVLKWLYESEEVEQPIRFLDVTLPAFLTATPETDAHQLARLMLAHQLSAALVVDAGDTASGLVTSTDFLRHYAERSVQEGDV